MLVDKIVFAVYGILLIAGGFMGMKAGSKVSLIMGVTCGLLVLLATYFMGVNLRLGYLGVTFLGGLLATVFLLRWLNTHAFMPGGMLFLLSSIILVLSLMRLLQTQ